MALQPAVVHAFSTAASEVCEHLTAELQHEARKLGVPAAQAAKLHVSFVGGDFTADSKDEAYLTLEYGEPGRPALGLLRRFNQRLKSRSAALLDERLGASLAGVV